MIFVIGWPLAGSIAMLLSMNWSKGVKVYELAVFILIGMLGGYALAFMLLIEWVAKWLNFERIGSLWVVKPRKDRTL